MENNTKAEKQFIFCRKCGKKLIEKVPNGTWKFMFGKKMTETGVGVGITPVEMIIFGSLKMRCIDRECRKNFPEHWTILNYLPDEDKFIHIATK